MKYIICRLIHSWYWWRYHECLSPCEIHALCLKCGLVWRKRMHFECDEGIFHCTELKAEDVAHKFPKD